MTVTDTMLKEYDTTAEKIALMELSDPAVAEYLQLVSNKNDIAKEIRSQAAESGAQIRTSKFIFTVFKKKKVDWKGMFEYLVTSGRVKEEEISKWTETKNESRCQPIKDESTDIEL